MKPIKRAAVPPAVSYMMLQIMAPKLLQECLRSAEELSQLTDEDAKRIGERLRRIVATTHHPLLATKVLRRRRALRTKRKLLVKKGREGG